MDRTPRLGLPFLVPGQAQKELFHNEALQAIDTLVAPAVDGPPVSAPPESPSPGDCYLIGRNAEREWLGKENCLAAYTEGGWRFITPSEGLVVFVRSAGTSAVFRSGTWHIGTICGSRLEIGGLQVVAERQPGIASPAGGKTIDSEARAAVSAVLEAMRRHGLIES